MMSQPADRVFTASCGARWRQAHFADGRVKWTEVLLLCGGQSPLIPGADLGIRCPACAARERELLDRELGKVR